MAKRAINKTRSQSQGTIQPQKEGLHTAFANVVKAARQQAGMSQGELARASSVSPKTIVKLEEGGKARSDAVIRLAAALGQPVEVWLNLSGLKVSESRIQNVLGQQQAERGTAPFPRVDPGEYFKRMRHHLENHKSGIMVSVITSRVPIDRPDLVDIFGELFAKGLTLAIACPFPVADKDIATYLPHLNGYYSRSYGWACDLAAKVEQMYEAAQRRVHVFTLKTRDQAMLVYPPLRATDTRPALIKYSESRSDDSKILVPARYAAGAYVRFTDGRRDQWLDIYDGEGEMNERTEETYGAWADYLSEIADNWMPTNHDSPFDPAKLRFWQLMSDRR